MQIKRIDTFLKGNENIKNRDINTGWEGKIVHYEYLRFQITGSILHIWDILANV